MSASSEPRVQVLPSCGKGRGLFTLEKIAAGETIFEEGPLVCSQFLWNALCKYDACEFCLRSLETAEQNARRLSRQPGLTLPHQECCETHPEQHTSCYECKAMYCSESCKQAAYSKYHKTLCKGASDPTNHPLAQLEEVWRNMHFPPETSTITLLTKLLAMIKQDEHRERLLQRLSTFVSRTADPEQGTLHKLLGDNFQGQVELLRELTANALYDESLEQWLSPEGFRSVLAMIGTNSQGIGTSSLSVWVKNCDQLTLGDEVRAELDTFIDHLYEAIDKADKMYDSSDQDCGGDAFLNCEGSGLFELQSAANHSCCPNAEVQFPYNNSTLRFVATADIDANEEVFISYLDECMNLRSRHSRQKFLRENYLFTCDCQKCQSEHGQPEVTSEEEDDDEEDADFVTDEEMED